MAGFNSKKTLSGVYGLTAFGKEGGLDSELTFKTFRRANHAPQFSIDLAKLVVIGCGGVDLRRALPLSRQESIQESSLFLVYSNTPCTISF